MNNFIQCFETEFVYRKKKQFPNPDLWLQMVKGSDKCFSTKEIKAVENK